MQLELELTAFVLVGSVLSEGFHLIGHYPYAASNTITCIILLVLFVTATIINVFKEQNKVNNAASSL